MQANPLLLCLSTNPEILDLRHRVLATRYDAHAIGTLEEMKALPISSAFDLLVICHTLKADQCKQAIQIACQKWPQIKVISITAPSSQCTANGVSASVDSLDGPTALFARIAQVLGQGAQT